MRATASASETGPKLPPKPCEPNGITGMLNPVFPSVRRGTGKEVDMRLSWCGTQTAANQEGVRRPARPSLGPRLGLLNGETTDCLRSRKGERADTRKGWKEFDTEGTETRRG